MAGYKDFYGKHKQFIPLVILFGFCVKLLINARGQAEPGGDQSFALTLPHYLAFAAVVANTILYFSSRRIYTFFMILTLVLGVFDVLAFTTPDAHSSYHLGGVTLTVDPACFYLLILAGILNLDKIGKNKHNPKEQETTPFDYKTTKEEIEVEKYKKLYTGKSTEDLEKILAEKQIRETARIALQQTLEERRSAQK